MADTVDHTEQLNNINRIFAIDGYEKHKIIVGITLFKAFNEFRKPNDPLSNQKAARAAQQALELTLNHIEGARPDCEVAKIKQSKDISFLLTNYFKYEKLQGDELIQFIKSEVSEASPFYEALNFMREDEKGIVPLKEVEKAITKRISEVAVKKVDLPDLPEQKVLIKALEKFKEAGDNDMVKKLTYAIQATGLKKTFEQNGLILKIFQFLTPEDAHNFMQVDFENSQDPEAMNANEADELGGTAINHGLDEIQEGFSIMVSS